MAFSNFTTSDSTGGGGDSALIKSELWKIKQKKFKLHI